MKKQNGFTLIELVVVIVILGILAVTAAPKFLNLQDDARIATLNELRGAMKSAAAIVYGKAAIAGVESINRSSIEVNGEEIDTVYGYPAAEFRYETVPPKGIELVVDGINREDNPDFDLIAGSISTIGPDSTTYGYDGFDCKLKYTEAATPGASPTVELFFDSIASDYIKANCK